MRTLNVRLAVILVVILVVFGVGVYFVHAGMISKNKTIFLDEAKKSQDDMAAAKKERDFKRLGTDFESACKYWGWYLRLAGRHRAPARVRADAGRRGDGPAPHERRADSHCQRYAGDRRAARSGQHLEGPAAPGADADPTGDAPIYGRQAAPGPPAGGVAQGSRVAAVARLLLLANAKGQGSLRGAAKVHPIRQGPGRGLRSAGAVAALAPL